MEATESGDTNVASGMRWYLHKPIRFVSFALVIAVQLVGNRSLATEQADILLHRQAPGRLFGAPSDTAYVDDFGSVTSALAADQFSILGEANICKIAAFAFFGGSSPLTDPGPPVSQIIRVRIYADAAGLPGLPAMEQYFANPTPIWT